MDAGSRKEKQKSGCAVQLVEKQKAKYTFTEFYEDSSEISFMHDAHGRVEV